MSDWRPDHVARNYGRGRPEVGEVVAYERRAWKVVLVTVEEPTPDEQDAVDRYTTAWRDRALPYRIRLQRIHGEPRDHENTHNEIQLRVPPGGRDWFPAYPNGRVPLCSCHGHPWPCLEADQQAQAEREMARVEKALRLLPGCCPACEEPVTSRQRSITFGGPNVQNPLAEGPTFHLRRKCRHAAARYEEAWVAAEPDRQRSLLTLACAGTVIVHGDGSAECFGADESDCPSVFARHRGMCACYLQSHGCGRGCSRHGHPGTRVAGYPADPRAVWS